MQNLKEIWQQACREAENNIDKAIEIYVFKTGAQIVSEYSNEVSKALKAEYEFSLYSGNLYFFKKGSEKKKILRIFAKQDKHVFSASNIVVDNRYGFWRDFIRANFTGEELIECEASFREKDRYFAYGNELKKIFGILEEKEPTFGSYNEYTALLSSISGIKANGDSVPFGEKYAILTAWHDYEDTGESLYICKEPLTHAEISLYEELRHDCFEFSFIEMDDEYAKKYGFCRNILEKLAVFRCISPYDLDVEGGDAFLKHLTIETGDETLPCLRDVSPQTIATLLPLVQQSGGDLSTIHSNLRGWSFKVKPLDKLLPFCYVINIFKDDSKKVSCILNAASYDKVYSLDTRIKNILNIFLGAWLKQTDVTDFNKIQNKILDGNCLFISLVNLTPDCLPATEWLGDFEKCVAFSIITNIRIKNEI